MECQRCGECCTWMPIARKKDVGPEQLSYLRARSDKETDSVFLVKSPCKHLVKTAEGIWGSSCGIYETRPLVCRAYRGKRFSNGIVYYVPEGCRMGEKDG